MTASELKVGVLVPAYNEAESIGPLLEEIRQHPISEILVVNDASTDKTAEVVREFPVTLLDNPQNLGKGGSLFRGLTYFQEKGFDLVLSLDGDGQHGPEFIPAFIQTHQAQPNALLIGARLINRASQPLPRYCANKFADFWVAWAAGMRVSDSQTGYRGYSKHLLQELLPDLQNSDGFVFESETIILAGRRRIPVTTVAIESKYCKSFRASHFKPAKDIGRITKMVARHLLQQQMNIPGLFRVIIGK